MPRKICINFWNQYRTGGYTVFPLFDKNEDGVPGIKWAEGDKKVLQGFVTEDGILATLLGKRQRIELIAPQECIHHFNFGERPKVVVLPPTPDLSSEEALKGKMGIFLQSFSKEYYRTKSLLKKIFKDQPHRIDDFHKLVSDQPHEMIKEVKEIESEVKEEETEKTTEETE